MGFRRLRGRLDQLQGEANDTMRLAQDLVADLRDGFGVTVEIDASAISILMAIVRGNPGKLPVVIKIDPTIDTAK